MSKRQKEPGETINETFGCVRPERKWPNSVLVGGGGGDDDDDDAHVSFLTEIIAVYRRVCCGPSAGLNELNCIMIQHV